MGKEREKKLYSKSDCTYLKKEMISTTGLTPLICFLNSHRSKVAMHSERAKEGKALL